MAVIVHVPVTPASRADANALDAAMEALMSDEGGPLPGLMVHITRPHDEGFMLCQVWRAEPEMRAYFEQTAPPPACGRRPRSR